MKVDKSINIEEKELSYEEKKELKSQNLVFIGGTFVTLVTGGILITLLIYSTLWRVVSWTVVLSLAGVFSSSVYSNLKDIKHGLKTIKKGNIWDIYELFTIEVKKSEGDIARREFFLRVGDLDHRYAKVSFDSSKDNDPQSTPNAEGITTEQVIELHYSHSGYLLKELTGELPAAISEVHIESKIKSQRRITQFSPRKWDSKSKDTFYYFIVNSLPFRVTEEEFSRFRTGNLAKVSSDITDSSSVALSVKDDGGDWIVISAQV